VINLPSDPANWYGKTFFHLVKGERERYSKQPKKVPIKPIIVPEKCFLLIPFPGVFASIWLCGQ
jgi:hypothetical protein